MNYSGYNDGQKREWFPLMRKLRPHLILTDKASGDVMAYGADESTLKKLAAAMFAGPSEYSIGSNPIFPRYKLDPHGLNRSCGRVRA